MVYTRSNVTITMATARVNLGLVQNTRVDLSVLLIGSTSSDSSIWQWPTDFRRTNWKHSTLSPFSFCISDGKTMNSNITSSNSNLMANSAPADGSDKKIRKPYTITKSRESWTEEEHDKFLEALQLFDRDWKKIEDFVGSKTVIQIRSHAQKYFLKVQKNGTVAHVPPPRPKRKAAHPYPQKASKNVLIPLPASVAYPSSVNNIVPAYSSWDDASLPMNNGSSKDITCQDELNNLHITEDDINSKGLPMINNCNLSAAGSSNGTGLSSEDTKQDKQAPVVHATPDFAEVYSFIGGVFDPETEGHVQKLKEMAPLNFETVLLLMRNLTINLSSPDFEPIRNILSSYDVSIETARVDPENDVTRDVSYQTLD